MSLDIEMIINGKPLRVKPGTTVAAAAAIAGFDSTRKSVYGERRGPLCGMGVCFECRVMIDGQPHRLACQTYCRQGMEVATDVD